MMERYTHTQVGYAIIFSLLTGMLLIAFLTSLYSLHPVPFIVFGILGICLILFSTLTVSIREDILNLRFGPGLIRKKFLLREIESCRTVKNSWTYGWGIHLTPHGWLYNVSGLSAVEIRMKNGKGYRIGTDEPEKLERAIRHSVPLN